MFSPLFSRTSKIILSSTAMHALAAALLWFGAQDLAAIEVPEPVTTIDATILPPPPLQQPEALPQIEKAEPEKAIEQKVKKIPVQKARSDVVKTDENKTTGLDLNSQSKSNQQIPIGDTGKGSTDKGNSVQSSEAEKEANNAGSIQVLKAVPVDAPIKDVGYKILYDVQANYQGVEAGGGASFIFNRQGSNYTASLSSKASIATFNATSTGEVRENTVATTRFKSGGSVKFLGFGKEGFGSGFTTEYPTQRITFGVDNTQTLKYDVIYDYVSAIVYIQAVLQNKRGQVNRLKLPVGKKKTVEMASVIFGARERLSTAEGAFEGAIPATIELPSNSVKSIKMWFVPEKNYRPLRIDLHFNKGTAILISRESN